MFLQAPNDVAWTSHACSRSTPTKPTGNLDVCLLLPQFPRRRCWHVFVNAQWRSMDEPCMPSSAHAARLQIPQDALDVRLSLPYSTHRRRRRVFINAQWRSMDNPCMLSSAQAARLLSPRGAYVVCLPSPQANTSSPLYMLKKVLPM